jgi:hypothetical protein
MFLELTTTQWGLMSDILGVLLLFKFGLPSKFVVVTNNLVWGDVDNKSEESRAANRKNKKISFWAHVGLSLLILGFLLQFAGTIK